MTLTAQQMRALPDSFSAVRDPRRAAGRRHPIRAVLAIAAGATLCGMRGYKAIGQWAQGLGQKGAQRIGCRRDPDTREYLIPSVSVIRDVLMRVDPEALDRALGSWNACGHRATAAWPSTARPCAAPPTSTAAKCT